MKTWLALRRAISSAEGAATRRTTSAPHVTSPSTTSAPASSYWESGWPAATPAPFSTSTETFSLALKDLTTSGTSATRRSPSTVSFGTPIFIWTRRGRLCESGSGASAGRQGGKPLERVQLLIALGVYWRDDQAVDAGAT